MRSLFNWGETYLTGVTGNGNEFPLYQALPAPLNLKVFNWGASNERSEWAVNYYEKRSAAV